MGPNPPISSLEMYLVLQTIVRKRQSTSLSPPQSDFASGESLLDSIHRKTHRLAVVILTPIAAFRRLLLRHRDAGEFR